jgi:hypothetical protein
VHTFETSDRAPMCGVHGRGGAAQWLCHDRADQP